MARKARKAGYHWDTPLMVRQPDGGPSCRWCKGPVRPPRRSFCGSACSDEWRFRTDHRFFLAKIHERDGGVCAACGLDTAAVDVGAARARLELVARALALKSAVWRKWNPRPPTDAAGELVDLAPLLDAYHRALRWYVANHLAPDRSPWQADHVVRLVDGGDEFDRLNIQSLCVPCHRAKTAAENRRKIS